jgi:hypothetical protein
MSAPRRHHYLPVFLLKRFRLAARDRVPRLRVLRRDRVIETAAHNIGVERDFHNATTFFSDPERLLSRAEAEFAAELARWKVGPLDEKGRVVADRLIPHLRIRSKIMRRLASQLMDFAVASTGDAISVAVAASRPRPTIQEDIAALIKEVAVSAQAGTWGDSQTQSVDDRVKSVLKRHLAHWSVLEAARLARALLDEGLPAEVLTGTHTTLIITTLLNHRKLAAFGDCRWAVLKTNEPLLLGDVGPLGRYVGVRSLKPMYMSSAPLRAIYLPIAPRLLLTGWRGTQPTLPSARALNVAAVALSHEFVVGTVPRAELERLRPLLGRRAREDSAEVVLGVETPSGSPVVEAIASQLSGWAARRIDRYWSGTAAEPDRILLDPPRLPAS